MKKVAVLAIALTAIAPAAFAYAPTELTASERNEVLNYLPNADLSNLTSGQVAAISAALSSGDMVGSTLYSILN